MQKVFELVNARKVLTGMFNQKMKASLSFVIANNANIINDALTEFDKSQTELYKEYGDDADENGNIRVPQENVAAFTADMEELASVEVPVEITQFTIANLDDLELSPAEVGSIKWMVEG